MGNFTTTNYDGPTKEVLMFDHNVAVNVLVSDSGIAANSDGRKIVPAGTIVGGSTKAVLTNRGEPVVKKNTQGIDADKAEGVLLNDVDVTNGPQTGAMVIHGFINQTNLPEAPAADAVAALKQITFIATAEEV